MIETAPDTRTRDALRRAHAARGAMFGALLARVFGRRPR